jgi:predicted PurR-regulated permease PerM
MVSMKPTRVGIQPIVFLLILSGFALYILQRVLIPFVLAAGLAYVISPLINWSESRLRLPRPLAVFILYAVIFLSVGLVGYVYGPTWVEKGKAFINQLPNIVDDLVRQALGGERISVMGRSLHSDAISREIIARGADLLATPAGVIRIAGTAVEVLVGGIVTVVVLFYLLSARRPLSRTILYFTPEHRRSWTQSLIQQIDRILARYLRGLLLIMFYAATTTWLILDFVVGMRYAVPIAAATGILEVVPVVGPIVSLVMAVCAAAITGGLWLTIKVGVFYGLLRVSLDDLLGPIILGKAAILHPVIIIFAFVVGGTLFGLLGLLLAVPMSAALRVLIDRL